MNLHASLQATLHWPLPLRLNPPTTYHAAVCPSSFDPIMECPIVVRVLKNKSAGIQKCIICVKEWMVPSRQTLVLSREGVSFDTVSSYRPLCLLTNECTNTASEVILPLLRTQILKNSPTSNHVMAAASDAGVHFNVFFFGLGTNESLLVRWKEILSAALDSSNNNSNKTTVSIRLYNFVDAAAGGGGQELHREAHPGLFVSELPFGALVENCSCPTERKKIKNMMIRYHDVLCEDKRMNPEEEQHSPYDCAVTKIKGKVVPFKDSEWTNNENYYLTFKGVSDRDVLRTLRGSSTLPYTVKPCRMVPDEKKTDTVAALAMKSRLNELERNTTCKVCLKNQARVLLLPCQHLGLCITCFETLRVRQNTWTCPFCRHTVTNHVSPVFRV